MKMLKVGSWVAVTLALVGCGGSSSTGLANAPGSAGSAAGGMAAAGGSGSGGATSTGGATGAAGAAGAAASAGITSTAGASNVGGATGAGGGSSGLSGLHVVGNHFEDGGKTVRLLGWNRPGGEYSCVGNKPTVFDGPTDLASIQAMQTWKGFNAVRLPLNETCWLGINGVNGAASGSNYITAVQNYVSLFRSSGIYVIVEMHWNAPGTFVANSQLPMADADHGIDFWKAVAAKFKGDPGIVFDLYNEP